MFLLPRHQTISATASVGDLMSLNGLYSFCNLYLVCHFSPTHIPPPNHNPLTYLPKHLPITHCIYSPFIQHLLTLNLNLQSTHYTHLNIHLPTILLSNYLPYTTFSPNKLYPTTHLLMRTSL